MKARKIYDRFIALTLSRDEDPTPGVKVYVVALSKPSCRKGDFDVSTNLQTITAELTENLKSASTFSVYPNPTSDEFTLFISNSVGNSSDNYILQDITGKTVSSSKLVKDVNNFSKTVNISALPAGIYFLTVSLNNNVSTKKIVKQ